MNNPAAAQQVIDQLDKVLAEKPEPVKAAPLPDTHVTLPGGFPTLNGVIYDAEVKELTGEDEEFIAKATATGAGQGGKMLSAILQRGVVSIGDQKADKDLLDGLLAGDRDALLLAIRRVTFGDDVPLNVTCQHCRAELEVILSIAEDVPVRELGDNPRVIVLDDLKVGTATVVLPTGSVQRQILEATDKTSAEMKTIWLRGCVNSINGMPVVSDAQVQKLGIKDRERILATILAANPGPRLSEIQVPCPYCEKGMDLPLDLVSLFRF